MSYTYTHYKYPIDLGRLNEEIIQSSISVALIASTFEPPDVVITEFEIELNISDADLLSSIISNHGGIPLPFPTILPLYNTVPSGFIVVSDGEYSVWVSPSTVLSGSISHSDLTNLEQDDHLLYVPVDGSRGFTSTVSGIDPINAEHLATKNYVDQLIGIQSGYPLYYVGLGIHIQVPNWGQYVIHETGYVEIAGTIELGEGSMLIIQGVN